jgi:flagellar biosynthesis protein FlhG
MYDQAQILRGMMERRSDQCGSDACGRERQLRTIAVTSGKGGVGKSNLALNLAIALQNMGHKACLVDANLGLGNIDLLCGMNGYWNLSHVVSGARSVAEITLEGPQGLRVIPGASGLLDSADCSPTAQREILSQLEEFESHYDYLVIDTGTGIHRAVRQFVAAANLVLIVTTPEPTSIADAYATLKALSCSNELRQPHIVVNQAESPEQGREIVARVQQTARTFLHLTVSSGGSIPRDPAIPAAVARRRPLLCEPSRTPAGLAIEQLARRIMSANFANHEHGSFFQEFARRCSGKAA